MHNKNKIIKNTYIQSINEYITAKNILIKIILMMSYVPNDFI